MPRENLPVDDFLAELEDRLATLGPDGVRDAVVAYARSLRPSQRRPFLDSFHPPEAGSHDALVASVHSTAERILGAEPRWNRRRWYEDPELAHPELTADVEDLLVALGERFLAGETETAVKGYRHLLPLIVATVDDDERPQLLVDDDLLREARDRYIQAIGSDDRRHPVARAEEIVSVLDDMAILTPLPSLGNLTAPRPSATSLDDELLAAMAERLGTQIVATPGWRRRRWLDLLLGINEHLGGLAEVADQAPRFDGGTQLDIRRWLALRHLEEADPVAAAEVLDEALEQGRDSYDLAALADLAAAVHHQLGHSSDAAACAARAWRAHPTTRRFEVLLELHPRQQALEIATANPRTEPLLAAQVAAVADDPAGVVAATAADRAPWGRVEVDAFAAAWLCATAVAPGTAPVADAQLRRTAVDRRAHLGELEARRQPSAVVEINPTSLAERLLDAPQPAKDFSDRLARAGEVTERAVERVLGAKQRDQYLTVAEMVVGLGVCRQASGGESLDEVVADFDRRYRRFAAFRRALVSAQSTATSGTGGGSRRA
ncbi:MAG: hypothetical protein U5K29_06655 [Acidimicrobiales bacterium]|nr:hypothetical protein [Acidimicrobiales bacterium]